MLAPFTLVFFLFFKVGENTVVGYLEKQKLYFSHSQL